MPRLSREATFNESSFVHLLVQGIAQEFIFKSDENKKFYFSQLVKRTEEHNVKILAYCIMGNHAHILITAENFKDVSLCFQTINKDFARFYNNKNGRVGYVFRNRFKTEPIIGESYLFNCIKYIHDNPVEAGIVSKPEDYKFSSAMNYKTGLGGCVDLEFLHQIDVYEPNSDDLTINYIDDEYECVMSVDDAIEFALKNLSINSINELKNGAILKKLVKIVQRKSKATIKTIASKIGISQDSLYKYVSN